MMTFLLPAAITFAVVVAVRTVQYMRAQRRLSRAQVERVTVVEEPRQLAAAGESKEHQA